MRVELSKEYSLGLGNKKSEYYNLIENKEIDYLIITNNSLINTKFQKYDFVDGMFIDVLEKTREYILKGYRIISHPLPASIRMMYSPVRSILLSKVAFSNDYNIDEPSLKIIEDSIKKYNLIIGKRLVDIKNIRDYEIIDYDLLNSAIKENDFIYSLKFL